MSPIRPAQCYHHCRKFNLCARRRKKIFSALPASFWSKNKGGRGGGSGPLGPSPGSATEREQNWSASSTLSLSVIIVTSYRRKIWLLYLFLSFLPSLLATATQAAESYLCICRTIVNQQSKETFAKLKYVEVRFHFLPI